MISVWHPLELAAELSELAGRLGRLFDARRWAALGSQAGTQTGRDSRTRRNAEPLSSPSAMLADLLPSQAKPLLCPLPELKRWAVLHFSDDAESAELKFVHENGQGPRTG